MNERQPRKRQVLETIQRLNRPVWAGDLTSDRVERVSYRKAFRALANEGKIKKRPGAKNERAYYYFTLPYQRERDG